MKQPVYRDKQDGIKTMMRFDRFTDSAQEAAQRSIEILQRYEQNQVDTEHILLGLLEKPEGMIQQILDDIGLDLDSVHAGRLIDRSKIRVLKSCGIWADHDDLAGKEFRFHGSI